MNPGVGFAILCGPSFKPDRIMLQKNYKAAISAILADSTTSAWLRDRIHEMEKRDPIDAATDAVVLSKLAELRMTDVFGIQYSTRVYLEQPQEPENRLQRPFTLIEQETAAA